MRIGLRINTAYRVFAIQSSWSTMQGVAIFQCALLFAVTLQLQSADGSPMIWDEPAHVQALSASALIDEAKQFIQVLRFSFK